MTDHSVHFSSEIMSYISPPNIVGPMRRFAVPRGSGRTLIDPATGKHSITRPDFMCDGVTSDGLTSRWSVGDVFYNNPPYGRSLPAWIDRQCHWGQTMPGLALIPARPDTKWAQQLFGSADAWLSVDGRVVFWLPIPIDERDAVAPTKAKGAAKQKGKYYLRRWHPDATDATLPAPFRLLESGLAVGPELSEAGHPSGSPFPSLIPFWADKSAREQDPADEREALRELVRTAVLRVSVGLKEDDNRIADTWLAEAERLLGSAYFAGDAPLDLAPFERLGIATAKAGEYPLTVREFARHFMRPGRLTGTLTVRTGRYRGVYR